MSVLNKAVSSAIDLLLEMESWVPDRIMGLHRRAYEVIENGGTKEEWYDLARYLGNRDGDIEQVMAAAIQIWNTAKAALEAGVTKEKAFPFEGDKLKEEQTNVARQ